MELAAWRLEISPKQAAATDLFLNVMQMNDRRTPARLKVERIDAGPCVGCRLQGDDAFWQVLFPGSNESAPQQVHMTAQGKGHGHYLMTGLTPGTWDVRRENSAEVQTLQVAEDSQALWFEGPPGVWTASKAAAGR